MGNVLNSKVVQSSQTYRSYFMLFALTTRILFRYPEPEVLSRRRIGAMEKRCNAYFTYCSYVSLLLVSVAFT
jgi:hypothetical protein